MWRWISNFSCTICVALSLIQIHIDVWNITSQNCLKLIHYVHLDIADSSSRFHPWKHMSIHTDRTNELARAWKDAWMSTPCCACQHVCEAVFVGVGSIEYGLVVFSFMWSRAALKVNIHSFSLINITSRKEHEITEVAKWAHINEKWLWKSGWPQ